MVSGNHQYPLMVIGTVAVDSVESPYGKETKVFGGSASYFSYAASFFQPVDLVAVVGEDFPSEYRGILRERRIGTDLLTTVPGGETFHWSGKYGADLNTAVTLETKLNVLSDFKPDLKGWGAPEFLFLANIDPRLQNEVLDQIEKPKCKFIACDTMNFWIEKKREELLRVLKRIHLFVINDQEARLLSGEQNLIKAARRIQGFGPAMLVIKKGEHGSLLFDRERFAALPAFPVAEVFDPTGAGDSFAGAMMGHLAQQKTMSFESLKRAMVSGAVMASFTVEKFGLERLRWLTQEEIEARRKEFQTFCRFDI